jgi:hypothetical protein
LVGLAQGYGGVEASSSSLALSHYHRTNGRLKRDLVINCVLGGYCPARQRQIGDHEQIQDVIAVHEHDLTAFRGIELVPKPVTCGFSDVSTGNVSLDVPIHNH